MLGQQCYALCPTRRVNVGVLCNIDPEERQSDTMKLIQSRKLGAWGFC